MGAKMLVVTDNRPDHGAALAERLGRELFAMRGKSVAPIIDIDTAIAQALASPDRPIVLADMADNPGGGSPGDSTYLIRALIDRGIRDFAAGAFIDPGAVMLAHEAGEGARLTMRFGGKACALSGDPLDLDVTVTRTVRNAIAKVGPYDVPVGDAAALDFEGAAIVLCTARMQTFGPGFFEALDVDWTAKKIVVVKSGQHYRAYFGPRAKGDIVVDAPGVCVADITKLPLTRIKRPMWPFDPDPFAT
jgi:microcystin degradation protein MlrC